MLKRILALSLLTVTAVLADLPPPVCPAPQCNSDRSLIGWLKKLFEPAPKKVGTAPTKHM